MKPRQRTRRSPPSDRTRLLDREQGILAFNERVLALAEDPSIPLLERLRFLTIVSNNLDEFFEVRIADLHQLILYARADTADIRAGVDAALERARALVARQYRLLNKTLVPALAAEGIRILNGSNWTPAQRDWADGVFTRDIEPLLTPIALDPAHPFPRVLNKSLNFVLRLQGRDAFGRQADIAIVQAPRVLPRVMAVPSAIAGVPHGVVALTSIVQGFVERLFPGLRLLSVHPFRVTRNSELFVDDDEITDLRSALQDELTQRHYGDSVRLEVAADCDEELVARLLTELGLGQQDCFRVEGPVNLMRLAQIIDLVERPDLKFPAYVPSIQPALRDADRIFDAIRAGDRLLHHPYESFLPVVNLLRSAASDPAVVAIKQTVYRTGADSQLMESLLAAAVAGKEVTVVLELMARFDEETNINWAARLEQAGAHVIYGVVGHKTHAKMLLVVRREPDGLRRYVHLGTGNYHPSTARLYEDFGLMTCDLQICADVHEVFRRLTGVGDAGALQALWQSPFTLAKSVIESIAREAAHAKAGRKGYIAAKINALLDPQVIEALYAASAAGVKVDLIVRGVCALRPGVPGLSENIRVRSIVGRFLEHSRVFHFYNDGKKDVWLSSADWMDRNLHRRVETAFPVRNKRLRNRVIRESISIHLHDNDSAWVMDGDGNYTRRRARRAKSFVSQRELMKLLGDNSSDA